MDKKSEYIEMSTLWWVMFVLAVFTIALFPLVFGGFIQPVGG